MESAPATCLSEPSGLVPIGSSSVFLAAWLELMAVRVCPPCRDPDRTRLAVPFRAANKPSDRSQFAQAETNLLRTTISYYYDGLSETDMLAALRVLLGLGKSAQHSEYDEWLALAGDAVPAALNSPSKIDTSNAVQMRQMHALFSHNMAAVNFWLNSCVFPSEMQQFPKRLLSSSWHLVDNPSGRVVGFSGTNDNHRLLPLQVHQHQEQDPTNGKMLDVILQNPEYITLQAQVSSAGGVAAEASLDGARLHVCM